MVYRSRPDPAALARMKAEVRAWRVANGLPAQDEADETYERRWAAEKVAKARAKTLPTLTAREKAGLRLLAERLRASGLGEEAINEKLARLRGEEQG
jgi:hypothetical protein